MRSVVVTGGSRGVGLAIVARLAASGFRVIAVARGETPELRAVIDEVGAGAGTVHFRPCDLNRMEGIGPLVTTLHQDFGPLYGLVNNAGIGSSGMLAIMPD